MLSRFLEEMGSVGKREARDLRPVFVRDSDELNRVWFPYTRYCFNVRSLELRKIAAWRTLNYNLLYVNVVEKPLPGAAVVG